MMLRKWEDLPQEMRTEEVRPYYDLLRKKQGSLLCKRLFDILASLVLLVLLSPVFLVLAIAIKLDSHGPVFYRQVRVTQYGREFRIFKFRTMVQNADRIGSQVTVSGDSRITRVGKVIRSCLDECVGHIVDVFSILHSHQLVLLHILVQIPEGTIQQVFHRNFFSFSMMSSCSMLRFSQEPLR